MNENDGIEKIKTTAKSYAQNYAGYVAIAFLVSAYALMALFQIGRSEKTIWHIVADGSTAMLLSMAVARIFSLQGILKGKRDEGYLETVALHGQVVTEVAPFIGKLDAWCAKKTEETMRFLRMRILVTGGLTYDECFDKNGVAKPLSLREIPVEFLPGDDAQVTEVVNRCEGNALRFVLALPVLWMNKLKRPRAERVLEQRKAKCLKQWKKEDRLRERSYNRAVHIAVTPLIGGLLTGSAAKVEDPFDFGKSVAEHEAKRMRSDAISRILTAFLFGYFGVDIVKNFSYEELFYRLLQVAIALAFGVVQQYRSFLYITEEKRGQDIKKIDYLQMFLSDMRSESQATCGAEKTVKKEEIECGIRFEHTEESRSAA